MTLGEEYGTFTLVEKKNPPHFNSHKYFTKIGYECDIFALGVIIMEVVTNELPYQHLSERERAQLHVKVANNPDLRPSFQNFLDKNKNKINPMATKLMIIAKQAWCANPEDRIHLSEIISELNVDEEE